MMKLEIKYKKKNKSNQIKERSINKQIFFSFKEHYYKSQRKKYLQINQLN